MVAEIPQPKNLYETDYNLWVLDTVQKLENREIESLDWENLIEEVLGLSRSDKRKLESLLTRLFEHLLKLKYWKSEIDNNQNHWKGEIINFRKQIQRLLKDSPSLKLYLEKVLEQCYQDSREITAQKTGLAFSTFPTQPWVTLEQILDDNQWSEQINK